MPRYLPAEVIIRAQQFLAIPNRCVGREEVHAAESQQRTLSGDIADADELIGLRLVFRSGGDAHAGAAIGGGLGAVGAPFRDVAHPPLTFHVGHVLLHKTLQPGRGVLGDVGAIAYQSPVVGVRYQEQAGIDVPLLPMQDVDSQVSFQHRYIAVAIEELAASRVEDVVQFAPALRGSVKFRQRRARIVYRTANLLDPFFPTHRRFGIHAQLFHDIDAVEHQQRVDFVAEAVDIAADGPGRGG